LLGVFMLIVSATITANAVSCTPITGDWIPDRLAGRALADAHVAGRLVTWFNWGEYAIWHLAPSVRVSLHGRRETVYSDLVLQQPDELNAGTPAGLAYLQSLNPDYVWLPISFPTIPHWLETHGYRIDVRTARSFVATRETNPVVRLSDTPLSSCFPGP